MKLSPLDIQHMEFPAGLNGYGKRQVREFLERVAGELEDVLRENQQLRDGMKDKDAQIAELQDSEAELKRVVIAAERIANEIRENAKREADLLVKEAEQKRSEVLSDADSRHERLIREAEDRRSEVIADAETRLREARNELLRLEREQRLFREQFRALLQAFARNLEAAPLGRGRREAPAGRETAAPGTAPRDGAETPETAD